MDTRDPTLPPCFGVLWQATEGTFCETCSAQHECLIEFVSVTMLAAVEERGGVIVPSTLAKELRIPRAAVISALEISRSWRSPDQVDERESEITINGFDADGAAVSETLTLDGSGTAVSTQEFKTAFTSEPKPKRKSKAKPKVKKKRKAKN